MSQNPYAFTPARADPRLNRPRVWKPSRPLGISILAVLHWLGGSLLTGLFLHSILAFVELEEILGELGIPPVLLVLAIGLLAVLVTASGFGMWMGKRWGWWLGSFYYLYSIFRNAFALGTVVMLSDELDIGPRAIRLQIAKFAIRVCIHLALYLYFFNRNVMDYFGLANLNRAIAVGIELGICVALAVMMLGFSLTSS